MGAALGPHLVQGNALVGGSGGQWVCLLLKPLSKVALSDRPSQTIFWLPAVLLSISIRVFSSLRCSDASKQAMSCVSILETPQDPLRYFYFRFAEGNVSIILRLFDPVHLTISAKFNFYAPNWPHVVFSLRHFKKISVKIAMARPRSIPVILIVNWLYKCVYVVL